MKKTMKLSLSDMLAQFLNNGGTKMDIDDFIKELEEERKDLSELASLSWMQTQKEVYLEKKAKVSKLIGFLEELKQLRETKEV